jgi:transposase
MSRHGSTEQLQERRLRAIALLEQGYTQVEIARMLGVTQGAVSQWKTAHSQGGIDALAGKRAPGGTPKLTEKQCQRLLKYLLQGPRKHGWSTELWTLPRIVQLIAKKFDVQYDQSGVWRLLQRLGWSCQKPERRARERDNAAIDEWRKRDWPRLKKRPK